MQAWGKIMKVSLINSDVRGCSVTKKYNTHPVCVTQLNEGMRAQKPDRVDFSFGVNVSHFIKVDNLLYRSSKPTLEQLNELMLNDKPVKYIIDLSFPHEKVLGKSYTKSEAEALGFEYHNFPFMSYENPSEAIIYAFFAVIDKAKSEGKKVLVHCLHGRDRTGLMVELYKIKNSLSNAEDSIQTLTLGKYRFSSNPLARNLLESFESECFKK